MPEILACAYAMMIMLALCSTPSSFDELSPLAIGYPEPVYAHEDPLHSEQESRTHQFQMQHMAACTCWTFGNPGAVLGVPRRTTRSRRGTLGTPRTGSPQGSHVCRKRGQRGGAAPCGCTDLLLPRFFMKIIASDVFHCPSVPRETVMSREPNVWRAARETMSLYSDEMLCALCVISSSSVLIRDEASLKSETNASIWGNLASDAHLTKLGCNLQHQ